jgi:hypothetical protein
MSRKTIIKATAKVLLLSLGYQLVYPNISYALTSGPSQPEVQSFEPVGTTDMVDLFSGDFVYNIPLLDVDGYPINISYHSGVNIEQEASWVGLGWNINPGVINRSVRGMPDDFNGDILERWVNIKDEKNIKVAAGGNAELFGSGFNLTAGVYVNSSNYRGVSAGMNVGANINAFGFASAGVNMGVGSQTGADIDYNGSIGYATSQTMSREFSMGVGLNGSGGYNSRTGVKDFTMNVSANYSYQSNNKKVSGGGSVYPVTLPVSLQNYIPVITNRSQLNGFGASIGLGGEFYGGYIHGSLSLNMSRLSYDVNGSRNAYGYLYLQNAHDTDIMDFTRDKDGMFNKTMQNLPPANTTYDVYSVSAQGTGGIFRPFRNDNGFVYDPRMNSSNINQTGGLEVGIGGIAEVGANYQSFETSMKSGPWDDAQRKFMKNARNGSLFENSYFKQAGELTEVPQSYYTALNGTAPISITPAALNALPSYKSGARDSRGNLIYFLTNAEASRRDIGNNQFAYSSWKIENYTDTNGLKNGPNVLKSLIDRENSTIRKKDRIAEVIQVNKDGSRYVYGLPAINNIQKEVSFSVDGTGADLQRGITTFSNSEDSMINTSGVDHYYSMNVTPAFAHSYLLTDVLSTDYVDVGNNGPSDDDLGTYVKFNYSRRDSDFRWRMPYTSHTANYNPGFYCDKQDNKANYIIGSKEQWYTHSIETKNFVAEFYISPRQDGKGVTDNILPSGSIYKSGSYSSEAYNSTISNPGLSYKLDSIKLYNKHDRFLNQANAVPIKCVFFQYDYSLCPGTPNSAAAADANISGHPGQGKLTLRKIFMSYGNSDKNLLSPYKFDYHNPSPLVTYDIAFKDRWGNYKSNSSATPNFEFPYVPQGDPAINNEAAKMWQLNSVQLPSGGVLTVSYESDDYAYVQDRRAMEMFKVAGVGSSSVYAPNDYTLYMGSLSPFNYIYFNRRNAEEFSSDLWNVYLNKQKIIYYNFGIDIANKGAYEPVRGYAEVESVGACADGVHGYVKVKPRTPSGTGASISPMVYSGLNMARYYLPHLFYPGSDPDVSDLENILRGLAAAAGELLNFGSNPMAQFINSGKGKNYNKEKSFIRLCNPGLNKKGGGTRVKELRISDSWNKLAGSGNANGEYGNTYDYTIDNAALGKISSGVASYEPMPGGEENPFRQPAGFYQATQGSSYPPNDPVELFQEEPVGESLFPSPSVGYSLVSVHSIHQGKARSAQTEDEYEFYTARDFPIRTEQTIIHKDDHESSSFFSSKVELTATQGYSIILNDMHGKPRAIRNYALRRGDDSITHKELVTGQTFIYNSSGNKLNNNVPAFEFNNGTITQVTKTLGEEIDITVDSRGKEEHTTIANVQGNMNMFMLSIFPVAILTSFFPNHFQDRSFKSLVCTKVVQQYGVLKGVETIKDGAKIYAENLVYDPVTGEPALTRVNNEFKDPQYQMNYPAYWRYGLMGPASSNILVEDSVWLTRPSSGNYREIRTLHPGSYHVGDELFIHTMYCAQSSPLYNANDKYFKGWVISNNFSLPLVVGANSSFLPPTTSNSEFDSVRAFIKILRSGSRNNLTAPIQSVTSVDNPVQNSLLSFKPQKVINTKVTTYSEELGAMLPWQSPISANNIVSSTDTNVFLFGYRGNFRMANEHVYFTGRDYSQAHARVDGSYQIKDAFWINQNGKIVENPVLNIPNLYKSWKLARSVTKYNIWGNELENEDALGIPSASMFGFNQNHPVAVVNNARYYEMLSEGYEDFRVLHQTSYLSSGNPSYTFSPFKPLFSYSSPSQLSPSTIYKWYSASATNLELSTTESHTGFYSFKVTGSSNYPVTVRTAPGSSLNNFTFNKNKKYIISCWSKPATSGTAPLIITQDSVSTQIATTTLSAKTNPIDGWILYEGEISVKSGASIVKINFPPGYYYDDFRAYPSVANMKAFVYHYKNQKLLATLDENNFATFYEYDNEGQLVRVNKETERGILTVQESRKGN